MGLVRRTPMEPMVGDVDDHRPNSTWRLAVDPGTEDAPRWSSRSSMSAARSATPSRCIAMMSTKVVMVIDGDGSYRLDGRVLSVTSGDVVFIPAGAPHGTANRGDRPLHVHAVFPSRKVLMELLERNPAPGTEGQPPRTTMYHFATGESEVVERRANDTGTEH